ncbi:MAG: cobyric acid synthase [Clostridia bacterium]|nr:cobyric acid synthase [Clostridia bacterium]
MAKRIMIQGTMSNAGKSIIAAALCRIFKQDGYSAAPFKSQNMALNSYITKDGLEMGRAQVVQAMAAGITPTVEMNPILLKPTSDKGSQVIVNGTARGNMTAAEYFKRKKELVPDIMKAYNALCEKYDIIVIEGAGSPAEINLKENDIVNMGMAEMADAPVLLVGDIDRGGVFAQLYGTVELLEKNERDRIKGFIINKFRGDVSILKPGLDMIENLTGIKVVGVVPYGDFKIDDEDSLSERLTSEGGGEIDIAVIRLPRISNFTDFSVFEFIDGVSVRYVQNVRELKNPDMIIIPGTKNTIADMLWLRECGLEAAIKKYKGIVFGICGGFQMLGKSITDTANAEGGGAVRGMELLPIETEFKQEKTRSQVSGTIENVSGVLSALNGMEYEGYEIHMGVSGKNDVIVSEGNIYGTYVHGIFDKCAADVVKCICAQKGIDFENIKSVDIDALRERELDKLADLVRGSVDMEMIYKIMNEGETL